MRAASSTSNQCPDYTGHAVLSKVGRAHNMMESHCLLIPLSEHITLKMAQTAHRFS